MKPKEGLTFSRAEHLKSRKQIEELFAGGKTFFVHPIKVYWKLVIAEKDLVANVKVGVSASKRNFKKAIERNRVKRLLRETYRLNKRELIDFLAANPKSLQVFFIYVDKTLPTFENLEIKMKICLKKLQRLAEETL